MLKKEITYEGIDGPVTETFYFGITKAELVEMEHAKPGGFKNYVEALISANDGRTILTLIKDFIGMTVGKRVDDRFVKDPDFTKAFMSSEPYSVVFMEFLENPNSVEGFIKQVLPSDLGEKYLEEVASAHKNDQREYTEDELLTMDEDEFTKVAGPDPKEWSREHLQIAFQRRSRQQHHGKPQLV